MSERILGRLCLVGVLDGLILACPLILLASIWPDKRQALLMSSMILIVLGFLVTILGAALSSCNRQEEDPLPVKGRYRVNHEPE